MLFLQRICVKRLTTTSPHNTLSWSSWAPAHMWRTHIQIKIIKSMFYFLLGKIFRKVRLTRGARTFLRMGRLWYQWAFVGWFIISRLPWASCSLTTSTVRRGLFPRESLCRKRKSLQAPKETDAMGLPGASSRSSSLCSPMWSLPSLYLSWENNPNAEETLSVPCGCCRRLILL